MVACGNETKTETSTDTPQTALTTLLEGNQRFVNGKAINPNSDIDEAIAAHTHSQVSTLMQNQLVAEKISEGKLILKAAHYDVHTGKVTILP